MFRKMILLVLVLLSVTLAVYADTLKLKDGTSIEATRVLDQGANYWVKLPDGSTKTIPKDSVKEWVKASTPAANTTTAKPSTGAGFTTVKSKAEKADGVLAAVGIWSKWIDDNPTSPDLEAAKKELELWKQREKEGAEKINGKWVTGVDRKKLIGQSRALLDEGRKMAEGTQFLEGMKKIEEAVAIYPNDFEVNFELGYLYLQKASVGEKMNKQYLDKAIKALEQAAKLKADDAAVWSNLAIGYNFNKQYVPAVKMAYKAVQLKNEKEIIANLVACIRYAPPGMRNNADLKPIIDDTILLAERAGVQQGGFSYIRPEMVKRDEKGRPQGAVSAGSGFIVTADGYIITNRHVTCGDPKGPIDQSLTFRVELDDGTQKMADLIAVDDKADIALLKIKADKPLPYLKIADNNPKQGSKAMVLGYPSVNENWFDQHSLQVDEGDVKSIQPGDPQEVWLNLNTTHGNSGGPIVDRANRVIGILQGGRQVHNMLIVLGVGPNQIQDMMKRMGDAAPKLEYVPLPKDAPEFNGEKLTAQAKVSTVYVLCIRSGDNNHKNAIAVKDDGLAPDGSKRPPQPETPAPAEEPKPAEGGETPAEGGEGQGGAEGPKRSMQ